MGDPTNPTTGRPAAGITMLDGAALVTGAAVASVHFRDINDDVSALTAVGWPALLASFAWLSVTAAGPFLYLVRRGARRIDGYPGPWDLAWAAMGLPWTVAALFRSGAGSLTEAAASSYATALFLGLFAGSGLAIRRVVGAWSRRPDEAPTGPSTAWTGRIGQAVAVAWPIQLGLGFVVTK